MDRIILKCSKLPAVNHLYFLSVRALRISDKSLQGFYRQVREGSGFFCHTLGSNSSPTPHRRPTTSKPQPRYPLYAVFNICKWYFRNH